jgi:hypothetical protein
MPNRTRRAGILLSYVDMLLVIVAILIVSVAPKKVADGVHVEAQYLVSIEWDRILDDDVDLWATGPPNPSKPCFYQNVEAGALSLDRDSRGYMDDKMTVDGQTVYLPHKEVLTLRGVVPGRYTYGIHLYKARRSEDGRARDPHALGTVVHVEVIKLNPKVTSVFRKDFTLDYEGDAVNVWAMDVLPDGNFAEADPPVEPITAKFYRTNKEQEAALPAPHTP